MGSIPTIVVVIYHRSMGDGSMDGVFVVLRAPFSEKNGDDAFLHRYNAADHKGETEMDSDEGSGGDDDDVSVVMIIVVGVEIMTHQPSFTAI